MDDVLIRDITAPGLGHRPPDTPATRDASAPQPVDVSAEDFSADNPLRLGRPRHPDRPGHLDLPESDGEIVKNFQEHPQSVLLTDSITPWLDRLHPDGRYAIGQDCGIYWGETDPPLRGAEAPDWFYVPNVAPELDGQLRRSYVLWQEEQIPLIVLEFASRNGREERDATPSGRLDAQGDPQKPGKFWVYEREIGIPYYGIFVARQEHLEMYQLEQGRYRRLEPNAAGRYAIAPLGLELGLWRGKYLTCDSHLWLRWWDSAGNLLLMGHEQAALERQIAGQERQRARVAEQEASAERQRADRLAERLRALGINPDEL